VGCGRIVAVARVLVAAEAGDAFLRGPASLLVWRGCGDGGRGVGGCGGGVGWGRKGGLVKGVLFSRFRFCLVR
jgi:hypothetical protein